MPTIALNGMNQEKVLHLPERIPALFHLRTIARMIKAIITDLDGTLLPRGRSISADTLEAFRLAGNKGCIRIIATGRNLYSALKILPAGFPIDYLVFLFRCRYTTLERSPIAVGSSPQYVRDPGNSLLSLGI